MKQMDMNTKQVNLFKYLTIHGCKSIQSSAIPDKNYCIKIDKHYFDEYTESTFRKFLDDEDDYFDINSFVMFLSNSENLSKMNKSDNPRGKYHEVMDLYHAMYDIKIHTNGRLPDYTNYKMIEPTRDEYKFCWIITHLIDDNLFFKQIRGCFKMVYQKGFDDRYYDMCIEIVKIIIEIQENSMAHAKNTNDNIKEAVAKYESYVPSYFKLQNWIKCNYEYLNTYWCDELKPLMLGSLFAMNEQAVRKYYPFRFIERTKQHRIKLENQKELLQLNTPEYKNIERRIKYYERFNDLDESSSVISRILMWRGETKTNNDPIIPIDDPLITKIFERKPIEEVKQIIKDKYEWSLVNDKMCINLKILQEIIMLEPNDSDIFVRKSLLEYLNEVEDIAGEIRSLIIKFFNRKIEKSNGIHELYTNHLKQKSKEYYEPQIKKLEDEVNSKTIENGMLAKKVKKRDTCVKKLIKLVKPKIPTKSKKGRELLVDINKLTDELTIDVQETIKKNIIPSKIKGKSIIDNIPDFPIIYTDNPFNFVRSSDFDGICDSYKITIHTRNMLKKFIFSDACNQTETIPYIINALSEKYVDNKNEDEIEDDNYKNDDDEYEVFTIDETNVMGLDGMAKFNLDDEL